MSISPDESKPNPKREEEKNPDNAKYPYHEVMAMQGGHKIEIGHEPGKEYFRLMHKSGSSVIFNPDGKMIIKTVGELRTENEAGATVTIGQNSDLHVTGQAKITVGGGATLQITGDVDIVAGGSVNLVAAKDFNIAAKGNMNMYVGKNINMNASGSMKTDVKGSVQTKSGGSITDSASQSARYESGGRMDIGSGTTIGIRAVSVQSTTDTRDGFTDAVQTDTV